MCKVYTQQVSVTSLKNTDVHVRRSKPSEVDNCHSSDRVPCLRLVSSPYNTYMPTHKLLLDDAKITWVCGGRHFELCQFHFQGKSCVVCHFNTSCRHTRGAEKYQELTKNSE